MSDILDNLDTSELDGSALAYFGNELRRFRVAAGMTQSQLGDQIAYSGGLVGMVETAKRIPKRDFVDRCDDVLKTDGALARIWPLVAKQTYPRWFRPYVEVEAAATSIVTYELQAFPGLFQTEDYARALLRAGRPRDTDEEIDQLVTARLDRQQVLARPDRPVIWAILDEAVLHRPIGSADVMNGQLENLLDQAQHRDTLVQVLPYSVGAHPGMVGSGFMLLEVRRGEGRLPEKLAYYDTPDNGRLVVRPHDVADMAHRLDMIRALALSPDESTKLIARTIGEDSE